MHLTTNSALAMAQCKNALMSAQDSECMTTNAALKYGKCVVLAQYMCSELLGWNRCGCEHPGACETQSNHDT